MVEAGLPVPPGAVLTTEFFAPWFDELQASATWTALADATPDKWATLCNELRALCPALPLTATQRQALEDLRKNLAALGDDVLFAVRSSSPEEDLVSASFAGGYETRLGVRPADLDDAVRHCFASSLDERVFVYKKKHGFDVLSPRIAVVVQQQIDSEVAGVGFSLNPLTNDYDEAVIEANWGLGESVVVVDAKAVGTVGHGREPCSRRRVYGRTVDAVHDRVAGDTHSRVFVDWPLAFGFRTAGLALLIVTSSVASPFRRLRSHVPSCATMK